MAKRDGFDTTKYVLQDLSEAELKALIDQFPGGDEEDYAFLAALLDEYADRPDPFSKEESDAAMARCMDSLGLTPAKPARKKGRALRVILAAAIAAALLAGTALAVSGHLGLFRSFFGRQAVVPTPDNMEPVVVEPHEESMLDKDKGVITSHLPGYELVEVSEEEADRLLGPYVKELDESCTVDGYTVTLLAYIQDEADTVRLYYSIENPDGLDNIALTDNNGYTCVTFKDWEQFHALPVGSMAYVDLARSVDPEKKIYVCVPGVTFVDGSGAFLEVCGAASNGETAERFFVTADRLAPAVTATNGRYQIELSAMGARITDLAHKGMLVFEASDFVITFDDGSEFVVEEKDVTRNSSYVCFGYTGDNESFCFNRLIDPERVTSVTVNGETLTMN